MKLVRRFVVPVLAIAGSLAIVTASAAAAPKTYRPNKPGDHVPNGCTHHDCTLREAVIRSNHHDGKDTILLKRKTYNLRIAASGPDDETTGDLNITDPVQIKHKGKGRAVVEGNGLDTVIHQTTPDTDHYTKLVKLVIRGGDTNLWGGGILLGNGLLGLRNCIVSGNIAGQDGGGIYATQGELTLIRSTVRGNRATHDGGGVYSTVETVVRNSTISGNIASSNALSGGGGGIFFDVDQLKMKNDTVANNSTRGSGGGILSFGDARLNNATVARNVADSDNTGAPLGGGLRNGGSGTFRVGNSVIALNHYGLGGAKTDCSGNYDAFGRNLLTTNSGCTLGDPPDILTSHPKLGKLANNGGPTKTIALLKHSPAINHARKSSAEKRDQRGHKRGKHPDIGAFER